MKFKPPPEVSAIIQVAQEKQAADLVLLDLHGLTSFTDYFLILTVRNPRQGQAISDEADLRLKRNGLHAATEGYVQGEWILMDYGFLVVHIFSEKARLYYDLERLWRSALRLPVEEVR